MGLAAEQPKHGGPLLFLGSQAQCFEQQLIGRLVLRFDQRKDQSSEHLLKLSDAGRKGLEV